MSASFRPDDQFDDGELIVRALSAPGEGGFRPDDQLNGR
jgi:hypothetical protein